ncbi:hypothetical protein IWW54_006002 [Coemansia sp. RSA 2705]|nr:hypothetical protein IWW54_006002 [Coemansia sp. RSA 2705]
MVRPARLLAAGLRDPAAQEACVSRLYAPDPYGRDLERAGHSPLPQGFDVEALGRSIERPFPAVSTSMLATAAAIADRNEDMRISGLANSALTHRLLSNLLFAGSLRRSSDDTDDDEDDDSDGDNDYDYDGASSSEHSGIVAIPFDRFSDTDDGDGGDDDHYGNDDENSNDDDGGTSSSAHSGIDTGSADRHSDADDGNARSSDDGTASESGTASDSFIAYISDGSV